MSERELINAQMQQGALFCNNSVYMYIYIAIFLLIKNIRFGLVDERERERKDSEVTCVRARVDVVRMCACEKERASEIKKEEEG